MFDWLRRRWGIPTTAVREHWCREWEYGRANDKALWERETEPELLNEAWQLREQDPESTFQVYLAHAELGSVWSMDQLGRCYLKGIGVTSDLNLAEAWYRRAAEAGSQHGMLACNTLLFRRGDFDACELILDPAAKANWSPALYWLARVRFEKSHSKTTMLQVRALLERAAADDCPGAQWWLGLLLGRGRYGLADIPRGLRLLWDFARRSREALTIH